jgi:hypothetical protein
MGYDIQYYCLHIRCHTTDSRNCDTNVHWRSTFCRARCCSALCNDTPISVGNGATVDSGYCHWVVPMGDHHRAPPCKQSSTMPYQIARILDHAGSLLQFQFQGQLFLYSAGWSYRRHPVIPSNVVVFEQAAKSLSCVRHLDINHLALVDELAEIQADRK